MPAAKPSQGSAPTVALPCAGDGDFKGLERCLPRCLNCRREVEASLTRVAGRKLRQLRALPSCSAEKCLTFLQSITEPAMRLHLSSMAWWRFSSDGVEGVAEGVRKVMADCPPFAPEFGLAYLHRAFRALSRLSAEQISAWFGCDDVYQMAALFIGERPADVGKHCLKCKLYKMGCTAHGLLGADDCPFWNDAFVQGVAATVAKKAGWKDPCKGIPETEEGK